MATILPRTNAVESRLVEAPRSSASPLGHRKRSTHVEVEPRQAERSDLKSEMPPRAAKLVWPNGLGSEGLVRQTTQGPRFEAASIEDDAVLSARNKKQPQRWPNQAPRPLPVIPVSADPTGCTVVPYLPVALSNEDFNKRKLRVGRNSYASARLGTKLEGRYQDSVNAAVLRHLAAVAGAAEHGLDDVEELALSTLFGRSLEAISPYCEAPQRVRNVAQALLEDSGRLQLSFGECMVAAGKRVVRETQYVRASFDARNFYARISDLAPLTHWFLPTHMIALLKNNEEPPQEASHAMGIGIQKHIDGKVRLSVMNSNGWWGGSQYPAMFKDVTVDEAALAMQCLLDRQIPECPAGLTEQIWKHPAFGLPLMTWFLHVGGQENAPSADFQGNGQPLISAPQKGGDCSIERLFVFMATALTRADYKLAKAECLTTVKLAADRVAVRGAVTASPQSTQSLLLVAPDRWQQRLTSSLAGAVMADAMPPTADVEPLPAEPAQEATCKLSWPNGQESTGQVIQTAEGHFFEAAGFWHDPVLTARRGKRPAVPYNAKLMPLPVAPLVDEVGGHPFIPRLPKVLCNTDFTAKGHLLINRNQYSMPMQRNSEVEVVPLSFVPQSELAWIMKSAAISHAPPLPKSGVTALTYLLSRGLEAIAPQCAEPSAVKQVAKALAENFGALYLVHANASRAEDGCELPPLDYTKASFDTSAFGRKIENLEMGESCFIPIRQLSIGNPEDFFGDEGVRHVFGLGVKKQLDGNLHVRVINPYGWIEPTQLDGPLVMSIGCLALCKTLSPKTLTQAMEVLLKQGPPQRPQEVDTLAWSAPRGGLPLTIWLRNMEPSGGDSVRSDVYGVEKALIASPRKGSQPDLKVLFAFMATELRQVDYKLAKAACLNTLNEVVDRVEPKCQAPTDSSALLSDAQITHNALQHRTTSSLGGVIMAPARASSQPD